MDLYDADGNQLTDTDVMKQLTAEARRWYEQAVNARASVAQATMEAADDAARRYDHQREGAPIVTISLDTPIEAVSHWSGDPDEEQPDPPATVRDVIIERAAAMLVERAGGKKAVKNVVSAATDAVKAQVDAQVEQIVRDTLDGTIQRTNQWGEPDGEATTLRALVVKSARDWLNNPRTDRDNRSGYGASQPTGANQLIRSQVEEVLGKELSAEITAAKAEVKKRVQISTTDVLGKAITDGLQLGR